MEKLIWKLLGILIVAIASFGFAVPYLISAKSDELVAGGFVLVILTVYFIIKSIIKLFKNK